jgi:hypothetical protein
VREAACYLGGTPLLFLELQEIGRVRFKMQDSSLFPAGVEGGLTFISICAAMIILLIIAYVIIKEWMKRL